MNIKEKLDYLATLQHRMDATRLHYDELRESVLSDYQRTVLDDIKAEENAELAEIQAAIDTMTQDVKDEVLTIGATVKGEHLYAVWNKGRITWDTKGLEGLAVAIPQLMSLRKEGEPTVTIRRAA